MKRIIISALMLASVAAMSADNNVYIYQKGKNFNHIKSTEAINLSHMVFSNGHAYLEIPSGSKVSVANVDSITIRSVDIPVLRFHFTDYPDATELWDKELYLNTELDIEGNGMVEDNAGLQLKVKGRGNSTWLMPKKPMRMKFDKKTAICGFEKSKNFVLLNNFIDNTLMRTSLSMWLARELGVEYANHTLPVHVYINDNYAGVYTMTEKVGINGTSVDIDEDSGILFELSTEFDELYKFKSRKFDLPVMVKDPDFDELAENGGMSGADRLKLWEEDFNKAEQKAYDGHGEEAFDVDAFVNYLLLYELTGNDEMGHPKSVYIHKTALGEDTKYMIGPAWDFDVAYNCYTGSSGTMQQASPEDGMWLNKLFWYLYHNETIKKRYVERFNEFLTEIYPEFMEYFEELALMVEPAAKENGVRWNESGDFQGWTYYTSSFDTKQNVEEMRQWIKKRVAYMDKKYNTAK